MEDLSTALGIPTETSLSNVSPSEIAGIMKTGFLPRLQLGNGQSEAVQAGLQALGSWAIVVDKSNVKDIGKEVDILVISVRSKALQIKETPGGNPVSYFDMNSADFKRVQRESTIKDSGRMYGPEFLIYVPKTDQLATLYMGSISGRRAAGSILTAMTDGDKLKPVAITCRSNLAKNGKGQSWFAPVFTVCTTPLASLPESSELQEELEKFRNPPASAVETVEPTGEQRVR